MPVGNEAEADGVYRRAYSPAHRAYGPVYMHKRCIAPAMFEAQITWVCNANEICCYDRLIRRGTCPSDRCF
jgi:hypothetical protein